MTHSVSHNLIFELNGQDLTVITVTKNAEVATIQHYPNIYLEKLNDILNKLPEIYSKVNLIVSRKDFIVIPEEYFDSDLESLYKLSSDLSEGSQIYLDRSEHGFGIVYSAIPDFLEAIENKFTRITIQHEITIILSRLYREVSFRKPCIYISINSGHLNILAIKDGKLQLCNSFKAKTEDDIFYFVMLAVEQLFMLPNETELVILGEPILEKELKSLFKNYIQEIRSWKDACKLDASIKNASILTQSFALQSLICE